MGLAKYGDPIGQGTPIIGAPFEQRYPFVDPQYSFSGGILLQCWMLLDNDMQILDSRPHPTGQFLKHPINCPVEISAIHIDIEPQETPPLRSLLH
jgi:hypothetical protein